MRILIYGFKPYNNWKENISEKVVKKIRNRKNLKKAIFNVKFDRKQFINEIKKFSPDIIIGLGLHPRSRKIRIERKAVNLKKINKKETPKPISRKKPKYLFANLKLKKDKNSMLSYNAGQYICNYSMYIISDCLKNIKFGFIHIPKDYNVNSAARYIKKHLNIKYI